MKSLPFIWLPLLSLWTILIVLFSNRTIQNIELLIPLVIYFAVSFIFAIQLGLINKNKKENFIVKFSSSNSLLICFLISTISIFSYLYGGINLQTCYHYLKWKLDVWICIFAVRRLFFFKTRSRRRRRKRTKRTKL